MSRYFLTKISIEGFRGIKNANAPLEIKMKKDSVTSLFAENGIGKSSFFQALEYALTGEIHLFKDMLVSEKPNSHIVNWFHPAKEATIMLTLTPDDGKQPVEITVKVKADSGTRVITASPEIAHPESFLRSLTSEFTFLDAPRLTKLIESTPLERGRLLSPVLGFAQYANFHRVFKDVCSKGNHRKDFEVPAREDSLRELEGQIVALRESARTICEKSFADLDLDAEDFPQQLCKALAKDPRLKPLINAREPSEIDFEELKQEILLNGGEEWEHSAEIRRLQAEISTIAALKESLPKIKDEVRQMEKTIQDHIEISAANHDQMRITVLRAANTFFENNPRWQPEQCPVCEKHSEKALHPQIERQLGELDAVIDSNKKITELVQSSSFYQILHREERELGANPGNVGTREIDKAIEEFSLTFDLIEASLRSLEKYIFDRELAEQNLRDQIEALEMSRPASEGQVITMIHDGKTIYDALNRIQEYQTKIEHLKAEQKMIDKWETFMSAAVQSFKVVNTRMVNTKISRIENDFLRMYRAIMSDAEQIEPKLVKESGKENIDLILKKFRQEENRSVRATLSESYRNNLAISLFLTAAIDAKSPARFIVLDDVSSSFDSGHQSSLMSYILQHLQYGANPEGLQFIILSHDGQLRKTFDVLQNESGLYGSKWRNHVMQAVADREEISIKPVDGNELLATINRLIESVNPSDAVPFIRQHYESTLLRIIQKTKIPVPFEIAQDRNKHLISNLSSAIEAHINLIEKNDALVINKEEYLKFKLECTGLLLNQGSHYSTASNLSMGREFYRGLVGSIDKLNRCFMEDPAQSKYFQSLQRN